MKSKDTQNTYYHIEFAKTGLGLSGGENCMIENIRYFIGKGKKNILLTTDNGKVTYEKLGLIEGNLLEYNIIESFADEKKYHIFIAYFRRLKKIRQLLLGIKLLPNDVVFCHSEFFPNAYAAHLLKKMSPYTRFIYWFHMKSPSIFKGYEGEYTGRIQFPRLNIIHYKLNQLLYFLLIKSNPNGMVLTVNQIYKDYLSKLLRNNLIYVIRRYSGVDISSEITNMHTSKKFDLSFMGRFHPQKGINEIIDVVKRLKRYKEDISIIVIGGGDAKIVEKFLISIKTESLEKNITYKGLVTGDSKFSLLSSSKVFLFPSYYESFGQVALEAMKLGLPVIAYDLPPYGIFEKGMIKVPILDNEAMIKVITRLLEDKEYYNSTSQETARFASEFSWEKTGSEIYNLINN